MPNLETFELPADKPIVSFLLPDSWKPAETDAGLQAVSVDGEIATRGHCRRTIASFTTHPTAQGTRAATSTSTSAADFFDSPLLEAAVRYSLHRFQVWPLKGEY